MQTFMGDLSQTMRCPECNGSGKVIKDPCPSCSGTGARLSRATVSVSVPAGSHDGTVLRVKGAGDAGRCGGARGDLEAELSVPSEHLTSSQEFGFTVAGVVLALLACTLFAGTIMRLLTFLALPLFFVFFMFPMGGRKKGGSFWNRAARRMGSACSSASSSSSCSCPSCHARVSCSNVLMAHGVPSRPTGGIIRHLNAFSGSSRPLVPCCVHPVFCCETGPRSGYK